jgi:prepilin-type N-terminal cleavage/methylation domain-containing protein
MRKGFTLVELMIVIAIIILIASIAVPQYMQYIGRAQLATLQNDMQTLQKALAIYVQDWGSYPVPTSSPETVINAGTVQTNTVLYKELAAQSATVNVDTSTTITGLKGGKTYLDKDQFTAIANHIGKTGTSMTYQSDGSTYTITITTKIAGTSVTITVTPSSIIQKGM